MKICRLCKQHKSLSEFHNNSKKPDGHDDRCRVCRKHEARANYEADPFKTLARLKKSECKKKGIDFNLDAEYLRALWTGICPITGGLITIGNKGMGSSKSAHLDRFNPDMGYVKGNVEYISGRMNRIKYDATVAELERILKWMKQRQEGATTIPKGSTSQAIGDGSAQPLLM